MASITIGSITTEIDPAYRALGGALRGMAKNVFTFQVKKLDEGQWYLITNHQNFIGRYPSQAACISVLAGIMTYNDGLDAGFQAWLNDSLTKGSEIDPDVNIIKTAEADPEITGTIESFNYAAAVGTADVSGGVYMAYETSTDGGQTWTGLGISTIIGAPLTNGDDGTTIVRTTSDSAWTNLAEDTYIRVCIAGADAGLNFTRLVAGSSVLKNEEDNTDLSELLLEISGSETAGDPVELGGYSYAIIDDSAAVLDPGESISYTYMWYREIPTLTSLNATQS